MSERADVCAYSADEDDFAQWGCSPDDLSDDFNKSGHDSKKWVCPHKVVDGEQYCPFHLPPESVPNKIDVEVELRAAIDRSTRDTDDAARHRQFVGARLSSLSLAELQLTTETSHPLVFVGVTITNEATFENAYIETGVWFGGATLEDTVTFRGATIEDDLKFNHATVKNEFELTNSTVTGTVDFEHIIVEGGLDFDNKIVDTGASFPRRVVGERVGAAESEPDEFYKADITDELAFDSVTVDGDVVVSNGVLGVDIDFEQATVDGRVKLNWAKVAGSADFSRTTIADGVGLCMAKIGGDAEFEYAETGAISLAEATVWEEVSFNEASVNGNLSGREAEIGYTTSFEHATLNGPVELIRSSINGDLNFRDTIINQELDLGGITVEGETIFRYAHIRDDAYFTYRPPEKRPEVDREYAAYKREHEEPRIYHTRFKGHVTFFESTFARGIYLSGNPDDAMIVPPEFDEHPTFAAADIQNSDFSHANLVGADFTGADLTESTFRRTNLQSTILERAKLSRSEFAGADLRGAGIAGAIMSDARINGETQFLGPPDDTEPPGMVSKILYRPRCVYDPNYGELPLSSGLTGRIVRALPGTDSGGMKPSIDGDGESLESSSSSGESRFRTRVSSRNPPESSIDKAKTVYRTLERIASAHGRPQLQTDSFVRRQEVQRRQYRQTTNDKKRTSTEDRLLNLCRYLRSSTAKYTLLYGESPWRIIGWSFLIILIFAVVYPFGLIETADGTVLTWDQVQENPSTVVQSLYFSTLTFTALGLGDFRPATSLGQAATIVETAIGAILLALLVFVLGRRAAR